MMNWSRMARTKNRPKHRVDPGKWVQSDQRGRTEMMRMMMMMLMLMKVS